MVHPRLMPRSVAAVMCVCVVMLMMPAARFPSYGANSLFPYSVHDSDMLTRSSGATPTIMEEQLVAEIISQIGEQEIYQTVYDLQNFQTRVYGYSGNTAAATYLYNRFDAIPGLTVEYQGGDLRNVIATLPGLDTSSDEIYIAGAHYDSYSSNPNDAPGATDNAAGVAIVLEFARIMSQYQFNHTLKFACWNREENGALGSLNYAVYASSHALNIPLYVNLDSSAYDPDDRFVLDIMYNSQSNWAANILTEHNSVYNVGLTLTYNVHGCGSDHRSFWQYGYTAVMTHEETHGPAHTPQDTVDKVSTLYTKKNGQLCLSLLARVAETTSVEGHDVEVRSVIPSRTVTAQGHPLSIGVTVRDSGTYRETFAVTTSANGQPLNETQVTLDAQTSTTFSVPWNTTGLGVGNCTLSAYAHPVPNETVTDDNFLQSAYEVCITIAGDVDADFDVDIHDIVTIAGRYGEILPPVWPEPPEDIDGDWDVDIFDVVIATSNYGTAL